MVKQMVLHSLLVAEKRAMYQGSCNRRQKSGPVFMLYACAWNLVQEHSTHTGAICSTAFGNDILSVQGSVC